MDSCKQLYSDVSSDFHDCENFSISELSLADSKTKINEIPKIEKNLSEGRDFLDDIPNVESFILLNHKDSFYERLISDKDNSSLLKFSNSDAKTTKRVKRWLKDEDRKLIYIILELK